MLQSSSGKHRAMGTIDAQQDMKAEERRYACSRMITVIKPLPYLRLTSVLICNPRLRQRFGNSIASLVTFSMGRAGGAGGIRYRCF